MLRLQHGGISQIEAKQAGQHFIIAADHIGFLGARSEEAKYLLALAYFKIIKKQEALSDNQK